MNSYPHEDAVHFKIKIEPQPRQVGSLRFHFFCKPDDVEPYVLSRQPSIEKPLEVFTVPQTQRQAISLMFSLFSDVLSYHTGKGKSRQLRQR